MPITNQTCIPSAGEELILIPLIGVGEADGSSPVLSPRKNTSIQNNALNTVGGSIMTPQAGVSNLRKGSVHETGEGSGNVCN